MAVFEQDSSMNREEHDHETYSKRTLHTPRAIVIEYSGDNPIYIGLANPGTDTDDPGWQIRKLTFDGGGNVTRIQYANGSASYSAIWDNRATITYI